MNLDSKCVHVVTGNKWHFNLASYAYCMHGKDIKRSILS